MGAVCSKDSSVPEGKVITVSNEQMEIIKMMKAEGTGVKLEDRTWHLQTFPQCFVGSEMVEWLGEGKLKLEVQDAVELGQSLLELEVFTHVTSEHQFKNEELFYHFTEHQLTIGAAIKTKSPIPIEEKEKTGDSLNLYLKIVEADDIINTDLFGDSDPYVEITVQKNDGKSVTMNTTVKEDTLNPEWDEAFSFDDIDHTKDIELKVYDKDIGKSELIGTGTLDVSSHIPSEYDKAKSFECDCSIKYTDKPDGDTFTLAIEGRFTKTRGLSL